MSVFHAELNCALKLESGPIKGFGDWESEDSFKFWVTFNLNLTSNAHLNFLKDSPTLVKADNSTQNGLVTWASKYCKKFLWPKRGSVTFDMKL